MKLRPKKSTEGGPELPYSQLAEVYDHVMRHVDYKRWGDYLQSVFSLFSVTPKDILELACGTGAMACILDERGYRMTGMDRSKNMIAIAEQKSRESRRVISYQVGDMVCAPIYQSYDAVLCLYDSINYVMEEGDLRGMMERLHPVINPGGIFIFDACTEINSRMYFHNQVDEESNKEFSYIRRCEYVPETRLQINEFQFIFNRSGKRYSTRERHEQRIYPVAKLAEICCEAGYRVLGAFDGFTFEEASEKSNRVHYVVRPVL